MIKDVVKRASFLGLIQVISAVVPIWIIPIAYKNLGESVYAEIIFYIAALNVVGVLVDCGMSSPAIRELGKSDKDIISQLQILLTVFFTRIIICVIIITAFKAVTQFTNIDLFSNLTVVYLLVPLSAVLNPYFIAVAFNLEKPYAILVSAAKLMQLLSCILLLPLFPLADHFILFSFIFLCIAYVLFLCLVVRRKGARSFNKADLLKFKLPLFKAGLFFLQGKFIVSLYKNIPQIIFGYFDVHNAAIAFFTIVRITDAVGTLILPLANIMINMSNRNRYEKSVVTKVVSIVLSCSLLIYITQFFGFNLLTYFIINLIGYDDLFVGLSLLIIIVPLSGIFLNGVLIGSGQVSFLRVIYLRSFIFGSAASYIYYALSTKIIATLALFLILVEFANLVQSVYKSHSYID